LTKLSSAGARSSLCSNAYAIVYNNPVSIVDLDGRNATTIDGGEVVSNLKAGFASLVQATSAVLSHPAVVATMQIGAGIAEATLAATMLAAPEPVATKVAGVALLAHAADQGSAGLRTMFSGRAQQSMTSQLAEHGALALGASPHVAQWVGIGADIAVPALLAGVPMLARATTATRVEVGTSSAIMKQIKPELQRTTPTASEWANMTPKQKGDWGVAEHMKSLLEREHKIIGREVPIKLPSGKEWKIDILTVSPEGVPRAWEIKTGMGSPTPNQWEAFTKGISGNWGSGGNVAELQQFAQKEMKMSLQEFTSRLRRGYVPMNAPH
jgi:hypothetical protein